jgi:hypothetical protein
MIFPKPTHLKIKEYDHSKAKVEVHTSALHSFHSQVALESLRQ